MLSLVLRTAAMLLAMAGVISPQARAASRPHVVWIVVDSWRWDHVDVYRPGVALMPNLAQRAQNACVFWRAYAASSWTVPSVASLFTGAYPSFHGATMFGSTLRAEQIQAPRLFSEAGYSTVAFSANAFLSKGSSFARGFAEFIDANTLLGPGRKGKVRAASVVKALDEWLGKRREIRGTPVFVYVHLMDPHWPYGPADEFLSQVLPRFGDPSELRRLIGELYFGPLRLEGEVAPDLQSAVRALYAGEVLATDRALEELFTVLERHDLTRNALIVLTADHGEELFDHNHLGHGRTLYEEVIRVPLLVWFPGQQKRIDIHDVVSLMDLFPTSLELAGLQLNGDNELHGGRSLAACAPTSSWATRFQRWLGRKKCEDPSRTVIAELLPLKAQAATPPSHRAAVIRNSLKLFVASDGTLQRYDLMSDPRELGPVELPSQSFKELEAAWNEFRKSLASAAPPAARITPDAATREQLRALGYGD